MSIRKRMNVLLGALLLTGSLFSQNVCVTTPKTSLILSAPIGGELKHVYYGNKLSETDLQNIDFAGTPNMPAYPVYGLNCPGESALAVKHADGNMTLQMEIVQTRTVKEGNAEVTVIEMKDKVYPFYVNVCYRTYQDADVIETWTEICHQEKKSVTLNQFASGFLPIRRGEVWLSHLYGSWANEGRLCQELLEPGLKVIKMVYATHILHTPKSCSPLMESLGRIRAMSLEQLSATVAITSCASIRMMMNTTVSLPVSMKKTLPIH